MSSLDGFWPGERPEDATWLFPRESRKQTALHTEAQRLVKQRAIQIAARAFATQYANGDFDRNQALLYHVIENLNSLVVELKRG
jgi:hypothetical protein